MFHIKQLQFGCILVMPNLLKKKHVCLQLFSKYLLTYRLSQTFQWCGLLLKKYIESSAICAISFMIILENFNITSNMRHCKLVHQSQSQNCAIFTSHIWSNLWKTNIMFSPQIPRITSSYRIFCKKNCLCPEERQLKKYWAWAETKTGLFEAE